MKSAELTITAYTKDLILVKGNTTPFDEAFEKIGTGKKSEKGWVFPRTEKQAIEAVIGKRKKPEILEVREKSKPEPQKLYFKKIVKLLDNVHSNRDGKTKVDRYVLSFDGYDEKEKGYIEYRKNIEISRKGNFAGWVEDLIPTETTHEEMRNLEYYYVDNPFTPDTYAWQLELLEKRTPKGKVEENEYQLFKDFLLKNMSASSAPAKEVGKEKEAWEMTFEEFIDYNRKIRESLAKSAEKTKQDADIIAEEIRRTGSSKDKLLLKDLDKSYQEKLKDLVMNNTIASVDYPEKMRNIHNFEVQKAIAEGKPVPAEVLAEYPELSSPAPAKEVGKEKEAWDIELKEDYPIGTILFEEDFYKTSVDAYGTEVNSKYLYLITDLVTYNKDFKISYRVWNLVGENGGYEITIMMKVDDDINPSNIVKLIVTPDWRQSKRVLSDLLGKPNLWISGTTNNNEPKRYNHKYAFINLDKIIKKAIAEGKPVPAEVLAEYPELSSTAPAEAGKQIFQQTAQDRALRLSELKEILQI